MLVTLNNCPFRGTLSWSQPGVPTDQQLPPEVSPPWLRELDLISPTARPFPGPGRFTHPLKGDTWQAAIFTCFLHKKGQEAAGEIPRLPAADCSLGMLEVASKHYHPTQKQSIWGSVTSHLGHCPRLSICTKPIGFPSLSNKFDFVCACVTHFLWVCLEARGQHGVSSPTAHHFIFETGFLVAPGVYQYSWTG